VVIEIKEIIIQEEAQNNHEMEVLESLINISFATEPTTEKFFQAVSCPAL